MPGEEIRIDITSSFGRVTITMQTRWENIGMEAPAPRELWVDVVGVAPSVQAAMSEFPPLARQFGPMIAFVTNVEVGIVDLHIAYDATPRLEERDFVEVFLPDERGLPTEGRIIDPQHLLALIEAVNAAPDRDRIARALGHYDIALQNWFFGGEVLAVSHLFMAAEALARAVVRAECRSKGVDERGLAVSLGIDPGVHGWKSQLTAKLRFDKVFHGDSATYRAATEASDGLEHGYMEVSEVHRRAREATEATFGHIRLAILNFLDLAPQIRDQINAKDPRDVRSMRRLIRGKFIGKTDQLAAPDEEYPLLTWQTHVSRLWQKAPREYSMSFDEKLTVKCAEGVSFQGQGFEVHGRLRPGQQPVRIDNIKVQTSNQDRQDADGLSSKT